MTPPFRETLTIHVRDTVKKLLPDAAVQEARRLRAYTSNERSIYLKLRVADRLGLKNPKVNRAPKTARKLLFVCFGNIMRSPMCEFLMNRELVGFPGLQFAVTSAGLNATPGRPVHPWALAAAAEFNISLEHHRARLLTREMVDQADVIFAMDYQNRVQLLSRWPSAGNKLFMLAAYASEEYRSVEISDPYYLGEQQTRTCFEILNCCIRNLAGSLAG